MKLKWIIMVLGLGLSLPLVSLAAEEAAAPSSEDLSQYKTADELWARVKELQTRPKINATSQDQARLEIIEWLKSAEKTTAAFVERFPEDKRRWDAKMMQVQVTLGLANLSRKEPDMTVIEGMLHEVAAAKDASEEMKSEARFGLIRIKWEDLEDYSTPEAAELDKRIQAFQKDFPDDKRSDMMQTMRYQIYDGHQPDKADALLKELAKSNNPQLVEFAKEQQAIRDLKSKPLELKFTAVDGSEVDIQKLRGKVVLVDFWATWCGPCVRELPHVLTTYEKYKGKGFEILGISLDKDKDRLMQFTKDKGMTWPQYFDGKVWQNEISTRFGIRSIPAMWLVDKTGKVRSTEAREDLDNQVAKLLAE